MAYGLFYNIVTSEWEYGCFPLPEVIYRRDFHSNPAYIKKLMEHTGGRLFNSYRFTKMDLYNYLITDNELKKYLPPTELSLNFEQVRKFIDRYPKVILKPIDLSRGRGICIIEKIDSVYKITDYRYKFPVTSVIYDNGSLEQFFNLNQGLFNKYLIQKYLNLARIGDSLFDIRVVMQKHKGKVWSCTGIEFRVSANSHLTNISRGGYALTLDEALRQSSIKDCKSFSLKINEFCQKFCLHMDQVGHHFAEFGMDIAVDVDQNIWLIEANVFPSFKGFKKTDRQTYLSIRYTPLLYALSLTQFGE
jgi:glutathione synthase/RimK-type ligase-like ATP-grasp enzyme